MIINFVPDKSPDDELFLNLKNKSINQKFIYFDSGAEGYYSNEYYQPSAKEFINFASSQITGINPKNEIPDGEITEKRTAVISLGCGNSFEESRILENMGSNVTLFAIDSSASMLELSEKILAGYNFKSVLIQADFTTNNFQIKLNELLEGYEKRIFYISGFTFCNFDSQIVTLLNKLMKSGDILMFYAVTIVQLPLYYNYFILDAKNALKNKGKMKAYFEPLKKLKIPRNSGKMMMMSTEEKDIGALCLQYCFQFSRKTKIVYKNETIEFLPQDRILIQTIRIYDYDALMAYFKKFGFNFLDLEVYDIINVIYSFQKSL